MNTQMDTAPATVHQVYKNVLIEENALAWLQIYVRL